MQDKSPEHEGEPSSDYEPPAIVESATFEHVMLACSFNSGEIIQCNPPFGNLGSSA